MRDYSVQSKAPPNSLPFYYGTVLSQSCQNCAIKPPAPIVLRDRHRRLCNACVKAPLGKLLKPPLGPEVRIDSDEMERAMCECGSRGVWLCQPCGRSIRSDDYDYKRYIFPFLTLFPTPNYAAPPLILHELTSLCSIWRWRNQYTECLGGLGTGIGEGDRGVPCARESACCAARDRAQETDCDAEDAREAEQQSFLSSSSSASSSPLPWAGESSSSISTTSFATAVGGLQRRTPSPILKPGYERHEIEGIGGVVKKKLVRMIKVGAGVPEWDDERAKGEIVGREVQGQRRSWCGWCWRVIPSKQDYEIDRHGIRLEDVDKGKRRMGY